MPNKWGGQIFVNCDNDSSCDTFVPWVPRDCSLLDSTTFSSLRLDDDGTDLIGRHSMLYPGTAWSVRSLNHLGCTLSAFGFSCIRVLSTSLRSCVRLGFSLVDPK